MVGTIAAAAVLAVASTAGADVVCNSENICWHTHHHYDYKPEFGITVHPDSWTWGPTEHYVWKEHQGRGYWRNGVWITF